MKNFPKAKNKIKSAFHEIVWMFSRTQLSHISKSAVLLTGLVIFVLQIMKWYHHATLTPQHWGGEMLIVSTVFPLNLKKRGSAGSFLLPYAQPAQLRLAGATSALPVCRGSWHNSPKSQMTQKPKKYRNSATTASSYMAVCVCALLS